MPTCWPLLHRYHRRDRYLLRDRAPQQAEATPTPAPPTCVSWSTSCEPLLPYMNEHGLCVTLVHMVPYTRRQADDGFRACAGPGGPGLRMVCGGDLRWRHHLRRWCKATSSWHALGSTTSSSPLLLKSMLLRSIRGVCSKPQKVPPHAFSLLP